MLHRDCCPHLGEHVTGRHPLAVHRQPGPDTAIDQTLNRERPPPAGHLTGWRQRYPRARRRNRIEIIVVEVGAVDECQIFTEQAPCGHVGDDSPAGRIRPGMGMDPHTRLPG